MIRNLILASLLLVFPSLAWGNPTQKFTVQSVKVHCDGDMQVGLKTQIATFSANVDLQLDDFRLRCHRLEIHYDEIDDKTEVQTLRASGNVTCEQPSRALKAWSDELRYDRSRNELVFSSKELTRVHQGENHLHAKTIRVDVETGDAVAEGGGVIEIQLDDVK